MLNELDKFTWMNLFACIQEPVNIHQACPTNTKGFDREDVKEIFSIHEPKGEDKFWLCFGQLKDDRYFYLHADYSSLKVFVIVGSDKARMLSDAIFGPKTMSRKSRLEVAYDLAKKGEGPDELLARGEISPLMNHGEFMDKLNDEQIVARLLVEHASILNKYGPNSEEAKQFVETHKDNEKFVNLAKVANRMK